MDTEKKGMCETRWHVERNRDIAQITVLALPLGKWETVVVKAHSLDVSTISLYDGVNSTDV